MLLKHKASALDRRDKKLTAAGGSAAAPSSSASAAAGAAHSTSSASAAAAHGAASGGIVINDKKKPGFSARCCRLAKRSLYALCGFLLILFAVLYYFLGTLSGARSALELSQRFIPEFIIIDTTIESGSVLTGLNLGHTLVDIRDVVAISADELVLDYDLSDIAALKFTVDNLDAKKLTVALSDKLFEGPKEEKVQDNTDPFRMSFPVDIDIHRFNVTDFAFNSQIVDVEVGLLNSALWAKADQAGLKDTTIDGVTVHLKNEKDVAVENADNEAVNQVDSSLAVMVDGQMIRLSDLDDASKALVAAAKQGKTVEMVIASEHNEREVQNAEAELFKDFNPAIASARLDSTDTATIAAAGSSFAGGGTSADNGAVAAGANAKSGTDGAVVKAPNGKEGANGERKIIVTPDSLVYKNPEDYARAIESALFNEHKAPVLLSEKPSITHPIDTKPHKEDKANAKSSDKQGAKNGSEETKNGAILAKANGASNDATLAKANGAKNDARAPTEQGFDNADDYETALLRGINLPASDVAKQAAPAKSKANTASVGVSSKATSGAYDATSQMSLSEQIDAQSNALAANAAQYLDAVTAATASTIVQQIRNEKSDKGEQFIAKKNEGRDKPRALVKSFGSGDGAIETLPSIVLPFDISLENLKATKVRYYQEGFDTLHANIEADAAWVGTNLKVNKLNVEHVFGEVKAEGDLNFDRYFDLDFSLSGTGYKNDDTHEFLQGLLYGLDGKIEVEGDLTDLRLHSLLNLGGSSELNVHANVLSAALPIIIDLKTKDITYPIFGEPLVNAKQLDLQTAGNLIDGIDVDLEADISGYGFENVVTLVKSSISYEKAHIETFKVNGKYLKYDMMADITGDVFYGEVLGADLKAKGKISDLSFVSPMLKGSFNLDSDLVAIINQKENARSALAVAGEPVYLANRIPKTSVKLDDFDADTLEQRLLAEVKKTGFTGKGKLLSMGSDNKRSAKDAEASANGADARSAVGDAAAATGQDALGAGGSFAIADADAAAAVEEELLNGGGFKPNLMAKNGITAFGAIDSSEIADAEEALLSGGGETRNAIVATPSAVEAVTKGQALSAVRPLSRANAWADGVADTHADVLISQQEYVDAVRFIDVPNNKAIYTDSTGVVSSEDGYEPTMLEQIFSKDLPEVMANVRFIRSELHLNGQKTVIDIADVVGDIHNGFRVDNLKLTQGDNTIRATGKVAPNGADLNAVVDLKHLDYLYPGLVGSVSLIVNSTGSLRDLNFEISGNAPRIKYGDAVVRKLIFNAGFNTQTRALNLTALADRVRLSKAISANRQCFIDVSGTPLRHNVSASCGGASTAYFTLDGSLNFLDKLYTANLLELYLSTESAGSLSLEAPVYADIDYGNVKGSVSPIELAGEIGKIYLSKTEFNGGDLKTSLNISEFDVANLSVFIPQGMRLRVPLQVAAEVELKNGKPNIDLQVDSSKGFVLHEIGAGVFYDTLAIKSHITETLMHNSVNMKLRNGRGEIDTVVDIKDPATTGLLSGYFKIKDFDLQTLSNIGRSFTELKGMVNVDSQVGGSIAKPLLFGNMLAKGSAVPRYDVGQVNDFDFKLALQGQRGLLDGSIILNGGELMLDGGLDWSDGANGSLVAQATKLPVFLVGYGTAAANINTKVTLGEILDISGKVDINTARIAVNEVAVGGKSVSSDEIIVPTEGTSALMKAASTPPMKSTINLGVSFGDDVRFAAMGMVKGNLAGGIDIYKDVDHNDIRSRGEINVVRGTADVYGRKFNFSTARVIFNREIANPTLNVEVVADPESLESDVVVGARVTGTAQAPDINLFSKPSMSENEILSYILYGHGLDKNVATQDGNNSSMLLGLGLSGLSGIAQGITNAFGMENVQVGTQGRGDETQVEVQGYVTRKLRLSYGYGVFNSVGEFKVRYELIRNLYAEFVSSIDQAVDLIYSFEFD